MAWWPRELTPLWVRWGWSGGSAAESATTFPSIRTLSTTCTLILTFTGLLYTGVGSLRYLVHGVDPTSLASWIFDLSLRDHLFEQLDFHSSDLCAAPAGQRALEPHTGII